MRTRRDIVKSAALMAAATGGSLATWAEAWAQQQPFKPEPGARIRFLRWSRFLDAEDQATRANIAAFTKATGVEVTIDNEWQDDIQAKAAVAASAGSGPDLIWALHTVPHLFPDKLLDLSDVADYASKSGGGWYPLLEQYCKSGHRWVAIANAVIGVLPVYRVSHVKAAGFEAFPKDTDGFLKLCQNLKANKTPAGFTFGKAPSDGNSFTHWILWSHGATVTDPAGKVVIDSPETIRALDYARALKDTFVDGVLGWNDASNNQAFLAGNISLTNNSVSIYGKARADKLPFADDIDHGLWPIGPAGKPGELHLVYPLIAFKYTKYPNAVKALLAFMMEKEQYDRLLEGSVGYFTQSLKAYESSPLWTRDPKITNFKEITARGVPVSYPAPVTPQAAAIFADFVVIDMFSDAVSGQLSPKEAAAKAARRARRHMER
jgi:multiple sugar transport system substrate-binding protein